MSNNRYSRRDFIRYQSVAGLGVVFSPGLAGAASGSAKIAPGAAIGGKPVFSGQWPKWPLWIPEEDEQGVLEVLRSGIWSRREKVTEFEKKWAKINGSKRCLALVNGTNAMTVSLIENNIGVGDEVLVSPYTYIATPVAVLNTGALPVFVDTDRNTFQIDVNKIEEKITPRTKAILPVHFAGLPCEIEAIMQIAAKHKLVVIEDACQAHLAEVNHRKMGTFGNAGCFSFQNSKNLAIGEGGAILSDDEEFIDRCYAYHNFGFPFGSMKSGGIGISTTHGNKLRFTEYQAAIGLSQLKRLEAQTETRIRNAQLLDKGLENIPAIGLYQFTRNVTRGVYHLYPFRYDKEKFRGLSRDAFIKAMDAEGIPCQAGYEPLNRMPFLKKVVSSGNFARFYSKKTFDIQRYEQRNHCPENDILCQETVWIPQNVLLAESSQMSKIAEAIHKIYTHADNIKI